MAEALVAALGVAISPFAVIPAILLLFTARPAPTSGGFGGGWISGVVVVTTLAVLLADLITLPDAPLRWASWTRIVLGVALVAAGLAKFLRRGGTAGSPSWLQSLESASPRTAVRFGLLSSAANPKVALLAVAGGFSIGAALDGPGTEVAAVIGFGMVAGSTALAPVTLYLAVGERVLRPLGRAKDWLMGNAATAMSVVLLVLGAALAYKGISSL